jgi:hypothetical protein
MKQNYKLKYCERLLELGLSKEQILIRLKTVSVRNPNYWIERGYSEEESKKLAKSRMPGTFEYFNIYKHLSEPESKQKEKEWKKNKVNTKENFIKKYGEGEGNNRWNSYCNKHREKNTFEFKNKKFGWTREQFDEYNKSRAVTLENLIKRHGDIKGREKWNSYCNRQSYTKSYEYVVTNYGEEEWEKVCKSKTHTYENFLIRYNNDVELATEKYNEYLKNHRNFSNLSYSKIANEMFSKIIENIIPCGFKQFYSNLHNQEWMLIVKNYGCIYLDFFLKDNGKVIEFYGDYWHGNPNKYKKNQFINLGTSGIKKVEEIWESDKIRIDYIRKVPYINDVKIIWEDDFRKKPLEVINSCIDYLIK